MEDFEAAEARKWGALNRADAAGKAAGTLVGRYIQHPYADSHATYTITSVTTRTAHVEHVEVGDNWVLPAWGKKAKIPLQIARQFVAQRDHHTSLQEAAEAWWNSQQIGTVVHFRYSYGTYVRGRVVEERGQKVVLPTALVGEWNQRDLRPSAIYPKQIAAGETMRPYASNIFENPNARRIGPDPAGMKPIDLEDPQPDPKI